MKSKRPPSGITPRFLWDEKRRDDIRGAIIRYLDADKPIPPEWVEEYNELRRSDEEIFDIVSTSFKRINEGIAEFKRRVEKDNIENLTI